MNQFSLPAYRNIEIRLQFEGILVGFKPPFMPLKKY